MEKHSRNYDVESMIALQKKDEWMGWFKWVRMSAWVASGHYLKTLSTAILGKTLLLCIELENTQAVNNALSTSTIFGLQKRWVVVGWVVKTVQKCYKNQYWTNNNSVTLNIGGYM